MGRKKYFAALAAAGMIGAMALGSAFNSYAADGWTKSNDHWTYIYQGKTYTGWLETSDGKYYMDLSDGHMTTGFKQIDGKWYFFRPNGLMAQSRWINPEYGKWYYFLGDGTMVTGWLKIGNDYYFMRGDGSMGTGWRQMDGAWYYFQSSGKCVVNSWAQIKDNWYLFGTDGKMMTGRDVVIAAMLGAEEFGFATAPLVTMGCVMMRVCNLDTCPVGVATQNPELRKRFKGKPEYVVNFMKFVAQEMREYMAKLGIHTVNELVGRSDLLYKKEYPAGSRQAKIDMSQILNSPYATTDVKKHFVPEDVFDFKLNETIDETVILAEMREALEKKEPKRIEINVSNLNRSLGTVFGSEITRKYYNTLDDDTYVVKCNGSGGQSFGAFIPKGLTLELEGDSNDFFGQGLSGGKLIVYPPKNSKFQADENIIIGNVALFGATSGKAFINGIAGERFCVRNSGATVVVEGVGDHGCEYMTGGCAVILGGTSKNFAAGMSGGIAYVLDEECDLYTKLNKSLVSFSSVTHPEDVAQLKGLIEEHVAATGSARGTKILEQFDEYLPKFKKIVPHDYAKMLASIKKFQEEGMDLEQAQFEAFHVNTMSK